MANKTGITFGISTIDHSNRRYASGTVTGNVSTLCLTHIPTPQQRRPLNSPK
jgi:hypothetical protein